MRKRMIALMLLTVFVLTAAGCSANDGTTTAADVTFEDVVNVPENMIVITDENGAKFGYIDDCANFTAVDGGIFYSVVSMKENSYTGDAEYRFFSLKDKIDYYLGKLENQGYEAGFARTELDGKIYALAVKGNPAGGDAVPLLLLEFDPENKTMKTHTVSEYGFPYAAMTASGGKLLIMNHETTKEKEDKIYEFDPGAGTVKEVLSFKSSEDSLRGVCAADDGFYLLRLKLNNGGENEMYVDRYDAKYGKISEQPVTEILAAAITNVRGISGRGDALNEIGMNVSRFYIADGRYMIYENFSLSRVAADLQTKETLLAKDDNYAVSTGSGAPLIYRIDFDADSAAGPEIYGIENGQLKQVPFTPDGAHKLIQTVTVSESGTRAILTSDAFPVRNGTGVIRIIR
ncbi:MAG: hypothetical protein J5585_09500 [Clostridia bacterium]|nr:hypothetical protein [Clostridia bacterium]